jgi:hypothetical protein
MPTDILEIAGCDVIPLFRPDVSRPDRVSTRRVRAHGETEWQWISEPAEDLTVTALKRDSSAQRLPARFARAREKCQEADQRGR